MSIDGNPALMLIISDTDIGVHVQNDVGLKPESAIVSIKQGVSGG